MRAPPVLGVDGCPAGWVGALLVDDRVTLRVAAGIGPLVASLPVAPVVVGIDIPIGLPDDGPREADRLARVELPPGRKSSVSSCSSSPADPCRTPSSSCAIAGIRISE